MEISGMNAERFSVSFQGVAFANHEISAAALAQSLLALDSLTKTCAHSVYGQDAEIDVKIQGSPRPGSFIIELVVEYPVEVATIAGGAVTVLTGVIGLAKWAYGRGIKLLGDVGNKDRIENESSNIGEFEKEVVRIYRMSKTRVDLARLTQTLDKAGAESMVFSDERGTDEVITRSERRFFRYEDGDVLTDNEAQMVLLVTGIRTNCSPDGWTFSEGEDCAEFKARMEDEDFLHAVSRGQYVFKAGTAILALVRTVQVKKGRTVAYRSILQVLEVMDQ